VEVPKIDFFFFGGGAPGRPGFLSSEHRKEGRKKDFVPLLQVLKAVLVSANKTHLFAELRCNKKLPLSHYWSHRRTVLITKLWGQRSHEAGEATYYFHSNVIPNKCWLISDSMRVFSIQRLSACSLSECPAEASNYWPLYPRTLFNTRNVTLGTRS
jgi:hypothetical protein